MRMIAAVLMTAICVPIFAQEGTKPGPEHEWLKKMEGNWTATMKFGGMESKGTVTYKMELGGLWLCSKMESELFGQKFSGKGMDTYNPMTKKYIGIWADSMGAAPVITEGTFDKDKKTLTMTGTGPGMDGAATKYKSVSEYPDDDTVNFTMYIGDTKEPSFTVVYKRKK